jgi:hypothetical protein
MKVLIVFLLVFSLQFPAMADCPLPQYELAPIEPYECIPNLSNDYSCQPVTDEGWVGSWQECLKQGQYTIYRVHLVREYHWVYPHVSFSHYYVYQLDTHNGLGFEEGRQYTSGDMHNAGYYLSMPPQVGSFINPEMECWCPPPPCLFPQCIGEEISQVFPFDIFLNIPAAAINCPSVDFFGQVYDLCWLYELLRWFKYPIAVSLLIKLAMHL